MPLPHLSHIGSLCKFPAGADDLVVGARTFLVTIGRVPAKQKDLNTSISHVYIL